MRKVLLIGGDVPEPLGPYADGAALLRDGLLFGCGVQPGGPARLSGRPPAHRLGHAAAALARSWRWRAARGSAPTSSRSSPSRPTASSSTASTSPAAPPDVPVYVGLAGPTSPITLLRYAQRCGVSASLRALQAQGMGAVRLFTHVDPDRPADGARPPRRSGSASNVVGVHLYSFGGVATTAAWMNARITGA